MKVALCLSGHLRSYKDSYSSLFDKIIDPLKCDIFIHTWDKIGFDGVRGDQSLVNVDVNRDELIEFYKAKDVLVEKTKAFNTSKYHNRMGPGTRNANTVISMFYGLKQCNDLKLKFESVNNFTYDVVIRARPDILINEFSSNEVSNSVNHDGIYFPKFGNYHGLNDQFAFGKSAHMNVYSNFYLSLDRFFNMGCLWHPESFVKFGIKFFRIPILRSDIKYGILRADGHIFYNAREKHFGDEF